MPAYDAIAELLHRVRRRVARMRAAEGALAAAAGAGAALLFASLLALAGWRWAPMALWALLAAAAVAGLGVFVAGVSRAVRGDEATARALWGAMPAGEASELLGAVELQRESAGREPEERQISRELAGEAIARAAERARTRDPKSAAPASELQPFLLALAAVAALNALSFSLSTRLRDSAAGLFRRDAAASLFAPEPIAGDVELRYRYPAYTGIAERVVAGTGGDISAPRGTEVEVRAVADRDLKQAFLVHDGEAATMTVEGRKIAGRLLVDKPGEWRLRYADGRGRAVAEGPPRPVAVEEDRYPEATLEAPVERELEVDPSSRVKIIYTASDDYALSQLSLLVTRVGASKEERIPLGGAGRKNASGEYAWDLAPLRLAAGEKVVYAVEAKDNDAVSGPKRGLSRSQVLKVYSEAEHRREAMAKAEQLWDRMIRHLGDRLEEPAPPRARDASADTWMTRGLSTDRQALGLGSDLFSGGRALGRDRSAPKEIARALANAGEKLQQRAQSVQLARAGFQRAPAPQLASLGRNYTTRLDAEVQGVEKDTLYLEDLLDKRRVEDLVALAKELKAQQRELASLLEKYRKAPDDAARRELEQAIARLRERIRELYARMQELAKTIADEHLNRGAQEALEEGKDLMSQLDEIQRMLQKGDVDAAMKALDALSRQLDKLSDSLQEESGGFGGEEYAELRKKLVEFKKDMEEIEKNQERVQRETEELRASERRESEERLRKRGADFVKKLREKIDEAARKLAAIERPALVPLALGERLDNAQQRLKDVDLALETKDFDAAREMAAQALLETTYLRDRLREEAQMQRSYPQFARDPAAVERSMGAAEDAEPPIRSVLSELDKLMPQPGQALSAEERKRLGQLAGEQDELARRTGEMKGRMDEIGKEAPIFSPQHGQMLQQAEGAMEQAGGRLSGVDPRGASSKQREAMEKLGAFREAMEEMAQRAGKGGGGIPWPWGMPMNSQGEGEGDGDDNLDHERVEIPNAEAHKAPEAFRKDILDAMKQPAPQPYKDRVRDYYEELVK